ncbi:MAG: HAD family phosphatase [Thermodesulfobacteriota bacterium]
MLKAIIFDFDGVIADTEPLHLKAFQLTLADNGIDLSHQEYVEDYLAYDDKTFFKELFKNKEIDHDGALIEDYMEQKSQHFESVLRGNIIILEGVPDFIREIKDIYPLSIGSGALRAEIVEILNYAGLMEHFDIIVSADDVENCKPDPEVYNKVLDQLNSAANSEIKAGECLVIEDSISGIKAAHQAGMKCLAISNSYSEKELSDAELVVSSLSSVSVSKIQELFK